MSWEIYSFALTGARGEGNRFPLFIALMRIPVLAIVGRPNVGKSAVFNRLAGKRISIVHDMPGVTRDRLAAPATTVKTPLTVLDTGGIGETLDDGFAAQVEVEADIAMEEADLILFVVDGKTGLTPVDHALADRLRKKKAPVVLAVNKVDGLEHQAVAADFMKLGFPDVLTTSATTGRGFGDLRRLLEERFPAPVADAGEEEKETVPPVRIALIGRPNVGKSSLVNAILNDRRAIVSATAGTTRDAIDVPFAKDGRPYVLIDTAGLRRRAKVDSLVEVFSVERAKDSVRRADVCALVVDAGEGVTMQERKIAQFMLEVHRPCIIVVNKFDLYHPDAKFADRWEELEETVRREFFFLPYAPIVAVSATERQYLGKVFFTIEKIRAAAAERPGTGVLNRLISEAISHTPPPALKGRRLKLLYATFARTPEDQVIAAPTVVCFVNYRELLTDTYQRFLEGRIREEFPFEGLPLRFEIRERRREEKPGPAAQRAARNQASTSAKPAAIRRKSSSPTGVRKKSPVKRSSGPRRGK